MLLRLLAQAGWGIDDRGAGAGGTALQVGAVPYRPTAAGMEILLITSRSTGRWILPKGWPVRGLSLAESAAREAYEEAGVRGSVAPDELARLAFPSRSLAFFPLEVTQLLDRWPEQHQRKRRWLPAAEAADTVSVAELGPLLRAFAAPA